GMSLLPDHAQTLQSQVTVDLLNALRNIAHLLGEAARRDHLHVAVELASHALHQAVHEPCIPVDDTGLDVGYRVAADRLFRPHELDRIEPGRLRDQRLGGNDETGRDGAADELAARIDDVEVGGRAEIHDDEGRAVERHAGYNVADAIRSNLGRTIHHQRDRDVHAGLHAERMSP